MWDNWQSLTSLVLFASVFGLLVWGRINHSLVAMLGASAFILLQFFPSKHLFERAVDWEVIFLLMSMMLLVDIVKETGAFQYLAIKLAKIARGSPTAIFLLLSLLTATTSAFLDNVTAVLIFAPLAILLCRELDFSPSLLLVSMAFFSNIGGAATLIGDPPNIIIGSALGLSFNDFLFNLGPLVFFLLIFFSLILVPYLKPRLRTSSERRARVMAFQEGELLIANRKQLHMSLGILTLVLLGFFFHAWLNLSPAMVAFVGASAILLTIPKEDVVKHLRQIDWETIFFLIALFIIVFGLENLGVLDELSHLIFQRVYNQPIILLLVILWISGLLSALLDNIPAVTILLPILGNLPPESLHTLSNPNGIWWALALGTCLGGNGTLVGSSANVTISNIAKETGHPISFLRFTRYGAVITCISLSISSVYLILFYA